MESELARLARFLTSKKQFTLAEIGQALHLSRRQLLYRLDKLNALLYSRRLPEIEPGSILKIDPAMKACLKQLCSKTPMDETPDLSRAERMFVLFGIFLCEQSACSLSDLSTRLMVSRNTVINDIRALDASLGVFDVRVKSVRPAGYRLQGDEAMIRKLTARWICRVLIEQKDARVIHFFLSGELGIRLQDSIDRLGAMAANRSVSFVEERLRVLACQYQMLSCRFASHPISDSHLLPWVLPAREKAFALDLLRQDGLDGIAGSGDVDALTCWILAASQGDIEQDSEDMTTIAFLTGQILSRFELLCGSRPYQEEDLFIRLYSHLRGAYYRLLAGLVLPNPARQQIQSDYAHLYSMTEKAVRPAEQSIGMRFGSDELAWLTMHFASIYSGRSSLTAQGSTRKKAGILAICGSGSAALMQADLQEMFPRFDFETLAGPEDLDGGRFDLLFLPRTAREKPQTSVPVITVSTVMTSREKYYVIREVNSVLGQEAGAPTVDMILDTVSRYARISDEAGLRHALSSLFNESIQADSRTTLTLRDLCAPEYIQTNAQAASWQEAIRLSYRPLLASGAISQNYVAHTIETITLSGPYCVIAPHVALAHTSAAQGSQAPGLALTVFETPVRFGARRNDPVDLIFSLSTGPALPDRPDHLPAMNRLLELLEDESFYQIARRHDSRAIYAKLCSLSPSETAGAGSTM